MNLEIYTQKKSFITFMFVETLKNIKMEKLKLESFKIAKLSNQKSIFGGGGKTTGGGDDGTDTLTGESRQSTAFCDDETQE